jgi:hypothetical protein
MPNASALMRASSAKATVIDIGYAHILSEHLQLTSAR